MERLHPYRVEEKRGGTFIAFQCPRCMACGPQKFIEYQSALNAEMAADEAWNERSL